MASTVQIKGLIVPGGSCSDSCSGGSSGASAFDLSFRNCTESYGQVRSGDIQIATVANTFTDLPVANQLTAIEFVALRTQAPVTLRVNGLPASAVTAAVYPVGGLTGLTLDFTVDGVVVATTFAAGDDTAAEVAARINAAAMIAGATWLPAAVDATTGQVKISGQKTGAQGSITVFAGTAVAALGLGSAVAAFGTGADVPIDGVAMIQFPRGAAAAKRLEISGSTSLSVFAAGT